MPLWNIDSPQDASHGLIRVEPVEVLAEFDDLLTFTFRDQDGILMLAHLIAVGPAESRYVVCKTTNRLIAELKSAMISIRSALLYPPLWLVDIRADGSVSAAWRTTIAALPEGAIPASDVLLNAELEAEQHLDVGDV